MTPLNDGYELFGAPIWRKFSKRAKGIIQLVTTLVKNVVLSEV